MVKEQCFLWEGGTELCHISPFVVLQSGSWVSVLELTSLRNFPPPFPYFNLNCLCHPGLPYEQC